MTDQGATAALGVPLEAVTVRLCKMSGEVLRLCEPVRFLKGAAAIDTVLRRAQLAGLVQVGDDVDLQEHWADLLDVDGGMVSHAALDAGSFRALKYCWMRTRYAQPWQAAAAPESRTIPGQPVPKLQKAQR